MGNICLSAVGCVLGGNRDGGFWYCIKACFHTPQLHDESGPQVQRIQATSPYTNTPAILLWTDVFFCLSLTFELMFSGVGVGVVMWLVKMEGCCHGGIRSLGELLSKIHLFSTYTTTSTMLVSTPILVVSVSTYDICEYNYHNPARMQPS